MSWFSRLFSGNKASVDKNLASALSKVNIILDDDEFQIAMLPDPVQALIRSKAPCDEKAGATGDFGMSPRNAIPVNGPIGQLAYLSKLRTNRREGLFFHRIGAVGSIDVFESVSMSGNEWFIFFLDMYYPRRSRKAPFSLSLSPNPSQFSGFTNYCRDFPHDFSEAKLRNSDSGLNFAYIPLSKAQAVLEKGTFERPISHRAKMDIVRAELSSVLA